MKGPGPLDENGFYRDVGKRREKGANNVKEQAESSVSAESKLEKLTLDDVDHVADDGSWGPVSKDDLKVWLTKCLKSHQQRHHEHQEGFHMRWRATTASDAAERWNGQRLTFHGRDSIA